jgi:hypothetical protein
MQTESNPQQPATTPTPTESAKVTTIADTAAPQAATAEPKPTAGKKPTAKQPARQRAATPQTDTRKPGTKDRQTEKAAEEPQSTEPAPTASAKGPREGATMWAILQVLGKATEPLSAKEIYAQIAERKLASGLKGKTPDQSVAAALAVAAKQRRYVERAAPGKFRMLKERS